MLERVKQSPSLTPVSRGDGVPLVAHVAGGGATGVVQSRPLRHLLRWAFNLAAFASALLLVATCVLWVRSYRVTDTFSRQRPGSHAILVSHDGSLHWQVINQRPPSTPSKLFVIEDLPPTRSHGQLPPAASVPLIPAGPEPGLRSDWHALGFGWRSSVGALPPPPGSAIMFSRFLTLRPPYRQATVPYWFTAAACAVPPAGLVMAALHRRPPQGRPLRPLRLRPQSHARPLPGMWTGADREGGHMKRLSRWCFNLAAALSAVLLVDVCVLACGCRGGPRQPESPPALSISEVCFLGGPLESPGAYRVPSDGLSLRALLVLAKPLSWPSLTSQGDVVVIRRWRRGNEKWADWIRVPAEPLLTTGASDFQLRPKDEITFSPSAPAYRLVPPDPHRREMTQPAD